MQADTKTTPVNPVGVGGVSLLTMKLSVRAFGWQCADLGALIGGTATQTGA